MGIETLWVSLLAIAILITNLSIYKTRKRLGEFQKDLFHAMVDIEKLKGNREDDKLY